MMSTATMFIKLAIIFAFSLQVFGSDFFTNSEVFSHISQGLEAIHSSSSHLVRRGAEPSRAPDGAKEEKLTKEEETASKLFESVIAMGLGLEQLTNLGSTTEQIIEESKKVSGMVPNLGTLTKNLLEVVPKKTDELNKVPDAIAKAGEQIAQSLKEIDKKPEDANIIKQQYKTLEKSFEDIINASDGLALAAIPKLKEALPAPGQSNESGKKEGEAKPVEQASPNKAEASKGEAKPDAPNSSAATAAAPPAEQVSAAQAEASAKQPQPETNAAPAPLAEQTTIEPIVPDVVIPGQ